MARRREMRSAHKTARPSSPVSAIHVYVVILLIAGLYAGIQATLPHTAFLSNDGGAKLAQVRALVEHHDPSIPHDPLGIEPSGSFRYAPFLPKYAIVHEGKMFSIAPFFFPLASSLPFSAFGPIGLFLLPWLGGVLTIWFVAVVAAHTRGHGHALLAASALGLASSACFYSLTFWEHAPSMALATAALVVLQRKWAIPSGSGWSAFVAGALLALGSWMRLDVHLLTGGLAVALLLRRERRRDLLPLGAGLLTGLLPFFLLNHLVYGSVLGPQVADGVAELASPAGLGELLQARWRVTQFFLLAHVNRPWLDLTFFLLAMGPAIYFRRIRQWSARREQGLLVWMAGLVLILGATLYLLTSMPRLLRSSMQVMGLLAALPVFPLAVARPRTGRTPLDHDFHFVLDVAVLVALLLACLTVALPGGLQWGPRYLLVLFPPLVLLAVQSIAGLRESITDVRRRRAFVVLTALLLIAGTGLQGLGLDLLKAKKMATALNNETIRAAKPPVVITDTWWFPQDSGDLLMDIPIYKVPRGVDDPALLAGLYRAGVRQALVVSHADRRAALAASSHLRLTEVDRTHHPRTPTFDLYLHTVDLLAPTPPTQQTSLDFEREPILFASGRFELAGDLLIPSGPGPHPAIIYVWGSGPTNRNRHLEGSPIPKGMLAAGFAVLLYDKPGSGQSTGELDDRHVFAERSSILIDAIGLLQEHPRVDSRAIGLYGSSQASYVIAATLAQTRDVAFLIAWSCPMQNSLEQSAYLVRHYVLCEGGTEADADAASRAYLERGGARTYSEYRAAAEILDGMPAIRDGLGWAGVAPETAFAPADSTSESFFDPAAIGRLDIPVLALFAENDRQIDPVQGAAAFRRLLAAGGHELSKVVVIPGADHNMNVSPRGCLQDQKDDYRSIGGKRLSPLFLASVSDWLGQLRRSLSGP